MGADGKGVYSVVAIKHRGVEGGTPLQGSLCRTCRNAMVVRGSGASQEIISCCYLTGEWMRVPWPVVECNKYSDSRIPTRGDMEDIAWYVVPRNSQRPGFMAVQLVNAKQFERMQKDVEE